MKGCKLGALQLPQAPRSIKNPAVKRERAQKRKRRTNKKQKKSSISGSICSTYTWILYNILIYFLSKIGMDFYHLQPRKPGLKLQYSVHSL